MIAKRLLIFIQRYRPDEGYLPLVLIIIAVSVLIAAVLTAGWVPEDNVVIVTGLIGLSMGVLLAVRPVPTSMAWSIIVAYGLAISVLWLAQMIPPLSTVAAGWGSSSDFMRQGWGLWVDRVGGWILAAFGGGRSEETIVFALGLGLLTWFLAAYAGWSTYRQNRPLAGLTAVGFALALNSYYGDTPFELVALFPGLVALIAASVHFAGKEKQWAQKGIDYSLEIRLELLFAGGAIALALLSIAYIVPTINFRTISQAVLGRPAVQRLEDTMDRVFAGVRQPDPEAPGQGPGGSGSASGRMPRSFLLGIPPELYDTIVFTASVSTQTPATTHWRGLSYDFYTGTGWAISNERLDTIPAGQDIPVPDYERLRPVEQTVHWLEGDRALRYSLGLPRSFNQEVTVFWRGLDDLSRVTAEDNRYRVSSQVSVATPAELRQVQLSQVPPGLLARYTQLPETIPQRVRDLAQSVAANTDGRQTPYDQAKGLERFLRQYPYSLDVDLPPAGEDPVDFFLFDLQSGYCDYYASAMVVMARSLGLPARLAIGFLAQPANEAGLQAIAQINAHSWAEVYFAGYGWIEFEPTAAFNNGDGGALAGEEGEPDVAQPEIDFEPPPIPERKPSVTDSLWWLMLSPAVLMLSLAGRWLWRRQREKRELGQVAWAYNRLQIRARQLGQPTPPSQTPSEFGRSMKIRLQALSKQPLTARFKPDLLGPDIDQLTDAFADRQYSGRSPSAGQYDATLAKRWNNIHGRLWFLAFVARLSRWF